MIRRDFFMNSLAMAALAAGTGTDPLSAAPASPRPPETPPFPKAPGLTKYVSEFIVNAKYADIPPDVLDLGRKSLLDGFGLALAGSASVMAPLVRQYLQNLGVNGKAAVIGSNLKAPARFAAFANGVSIHADDFDDTQLSAAKDRVYGLLTHPSVTTLPPAFAMCELAQRPGKDFILAYHVGVEVETKIAEAIDPRHYNDGFHTTGTCGSFGSAAACAKLRGLNAMQTAYALGVAAAEGGGLRDNFGSMTKPFHAGHAAENGTVAVDLAALGWTAAPDILEGPLGFFQAEGGGFDPGSIVNRLGKPWTFASPGVSIKPFPSGSLTHPAMGEWLAMIRKYDIKPADVEKIDIGTSHNLTTTLYHHRPTTGLEGKFSMEFGLSILVLDRKAGLKRISGRRSAAPRRASDDSAGELPCRSRGRGGRIRQDDQHPQSNFERRQGAFRPRRFRQGQPRESHELRRSGRQIPRLRRIRQVAQGKDRSRDPIRQNSGERAGYEQAFGLAHRVMSRLAHLEK